MWITDDSTCDARRDAHGDDGQGEVKLSDQVARRKLDIKQFCGEAPEIRKRAEELLAAASRLTSRMSIRKRMEMQRRARALMREAASRESGEIEREYERRIQPFMQACEHYARAAPPELAASKRRKVSGIMSFCRGAEGRAPEPERDRARSCKLAQSTIMAEYLRDVERAPVAHRTIGTDRCAQCDVQHVLVTKDAMLVCPECGLSQPYVDATSASMAYGCEVEFTAFSYKRINHFNEWLNQFQAKENTSIPQEVADAVMAELVKERVTDPSEVTHRRVRSVLKTLKLRKYYEHTSQLTSLISGSPPPRMTPHQEEMCRLMFYAIQRPFEKHCPEDRKNFLSYSYCLYKFTELLGYTEFMPYFSLLKGRDKLAKQDLIFSKICAELDWEFISSV